MNPKAKQILTFIADYTKQKGYSPTMREISEGVGIKSTSCVFKCLDKLESQGCIKRDHAIARSIRVLKEV